MRREEALTRLKVGSVVYYPKFKVDNEMIIAEVLLIKVKEVLVDHRTPARQVRVSNGSNTFDIGYLHRTRPEALVHLKDLMDTYMIRLQQRKEVLA